MNRRSIVAEFHKSAGKRVTLFSLTVIEDHGSYLYRKIYDVDHSRRDGYLFHQTGAGGTGPVQVAGIYFTSGTVDVEERPAEWVDPHDRPPWRGKKTLAIRKRNRTRCLLRLPKAFDLEPGCDLLDWLKHNAIEDDAVYCSTCRDSFPGGNLCDHCWWCHKTGWYSTPTECCRCKDRDECDG